MARNEAFFGVAGQERLASVPVTIVGLGGLGSHVAQQLAYLGIQYFTVIDPDAVEDTNLNRLIGATPDDVATLKVAVAVREIQRIQPGAGVRAIAERVQSVDGRAAIENSQVVFGCVDREGDRLDLLEMCARAGNVLIDLATEILPGEPVIYGGRIVRCAGEGCLSCRDLIDQDEVRIDRMNESEREAYARIYGVAVEELGRSGPSVVSLNGVVASLAVTEFMLDVTGVRAPKGAMTYRGDLGYVTTSMDVPGDCYYCSRWGSFDN